MKSDILVSIPGEEGGAECDHAEAVQDARDDILNALGAYPVDLWGDVLAAVVSSLFKPKRDAEEIMQEEKAKRAAEG